MRIGITDTFTEDKFENYAEWIHRVDESIEMVKLSHTLENADAVKDVDALVLTGGGDVHPKFYGKPELIGQAHDINELRDEFEFEVIEKALDTDLPILAICRGMQVLNVALGGTLIVDLPSAGYELHQVEGEREHRHPITNVPHSLLEIVTGGGRHEVNSVHHQAVDQLGRGLMVSALSPDSVIEAMEWVLKDRAPFLFCVQWHPERMKDDANPLSRNIREYFLREVQLSMNHSITT